MIKKILCFKCENPIKQWVAENQPYNAIHIKTIGHYGSTVIDSMCGESWLNIFICDSCLRTGLLKKIINEEYK